MSDLMDELNQFLTKTEETPETKARRLNPVLDLQREEIVPGSWCLYLGDIGVEGLDIGTEARVGYIFAEHDLGVQSAMTGEDISSLKEQVAELLADDKVYGRWYSESTPGGELDAMYLGVLLPLSEDEANFIRAVDFKMPIIYSMTDWFKPKLDAIMEAFNESPLMGMKQKPCPECGEPLACLVHYTGTAILQGFDVSSEGQERIQLAKAHRDNLDNVDHIHWICGGETCEYNEHVDMNEVEVFKPDQLGDWE